jgi:biotin carboxyl carrier protein
MTTKSKTDSDNMNRKEKFEIPSVKRNIYKILQIEDTKYRTTFTSKFVNRKKYVFVDPGKIISCLPGTIVEMMVKPGQKVTQGQHMVIYEAMKMKNIITAPLDGKVKILNVKKGEVISKGQLIAEIEQLKTPKL